MWVQACEGVRGRRAHACARGVLREGPSHLSASASSNALERSLGRGRSASASGAPTDSVITSALFDVGKGENRKEKEKEEAEARQKERRHFGATRMQGDKVLSEERGI